MNPEQPAATPTIRRDLLKRTLVAATGTTLAAPFVHAQAPKKIRILNAETQALVLAEWKKIGEEYKNLTGIEVEVDSNSLDECWLKLLASMRAGNPYDVVTEGFLAHVTELVEQKALMPLTQLTNKHKWGRNILFPINGEVYWYPYDYNFSILHYRKDIYAERGFKPARKHKDFIDINRAMTDGQGKFGSLFPISNGGATSWITSPFFWAEGVRIFDDKWNVLIDNADMKPRVIAVLDFMAELNKSMPPGIGQAQYIEGLQAILSGNVGHAGFTPAIIEVPLRDKTPMVGKIGLTTYPSSDGKQTAVNHGYDGFMVTKSRNSDEAMKFMEWFTQNRYIDFILTRPLHFQPARLDIYDDAKYKAHPWVQASPDEVKFMRSLAEGSDVVVRSIDTEGPSIGKQSAKAFESWAFPRMLQERLLRNTPAAQCVDIGAKMLRQAVAS